MSGKSLVKHLWVISVALLVALWPVTGLAAPALRPNPAWQTSAKPPISAGAAVLLDWRTGQVLYERNAYAKKDPASTTKVLTAILALEKGKLSDQVKVSKRAAYTPGSAMYIKPGQVYSLHDLLYGLLLRSGNDAAVAIAEHLAGSVEAFAREMNMKAKEIGATGTHFVNPHGLTDARHFTTAYDLALITRHALQNDTFRSIVAKGETPLTFENLNKSVVLYNTNRLLRMMPDADGVKTGTTAAAGPCLVASATRGDQKLVAVLLNAGRRWNDAARLLEWGFGNFQLDYLGRAGDLVTEAQVAEGKIEKLPLALSGDLVVVTPRHGKVKPRLDLQVQEAVEAPVKQGQVLGRASAVDGDQTRAEVMLVASRDVGRRTWLDNLIRGLSPLLRWMQGEQMM